MTKLVDPAERAPCLHLCGFHAKLSWAAGYNRGTLWI